MVISFARVIDGFASVASVPVNSCVVLDDCTTRFRFMNLLAPILKSPLGGGHGLWSLPGKFQMSSRFSDQPPRWQDFQNF